MKTNYMNYIGQTRLWWVVLIVGILMTIGGFAYWFWPVAGYATAATIFGWLLIVTGVVMLSVATGTRQVLGKSWWIAGAIINMLIGFILIRDVFLSERVLPYVLGAIFIYWGIESIVNGAYRRESYRWLTIFNGMLMCVIAMLFFESGWQTDMLMTSYLTSIAFIYWGITLAITSYSLKPYPSTP
jgi:uncharacterized membrane protein HdeD (DUF308 family)